MCVVGEPYVYIWTAYERIPEHKLTESDKRFGIYWKRLPCGDFSSEERANLWMSGSRMALEHPNDFKIEKHCIDYLLRCH